MQKVKTTEHLNVIDSGMFHLFENEPVRAGRRLYVGFLRDAEDDPKRWPAVTALFSFCQGGDGSRYSLEWLETSRYTGDTKPMDSQVIRDEFMEALEELHPGYSANPETREAEDGSLYYLDTLDAEDADELVECEE